MVNASNSFKEEISRDNRNYLCYADITLTDGTVLHLENDKIWSNGLAVDDAVSNESSFDIGAAIINKATLIINNMYGDFSKYDFGKAKVILKIGLELPDGTIEKVEKGQFTVDDAKYNGALITLEALDDMRKFDRNYSESNLLYPATVLQIVQDACLVCDVSCGVASLPNGNVVIKERPNDEALTFRQMLQWAGQITCQWFKISVRGQLVSGWYDVETYEQLGIISGGTYGDELEDKIMAGTFGDNLQNAISSGTFGDRAGFHNIHSLNSTNVATDDVVITGVKVTECPADSQETPVSYLSGAEGYVLEIANNRLIATGMGETISRYLADRLVGLRFRPMNISFQNDPTIEAGDIAMVSDHQGNTYQTLVTGTKFQTGSAQTVICGAKSPARNSANRYSEATRNYVESKKEIQRERTEREKAVENLNSVMSNASGMYTTEIQQADGSVISYIHDKKTLEESANVIKITAEAIGISTDGGKTYPYGLFLTGDVITRILYAVGINADYINAGALTVEKNGKVIFRADKDAGRVDIIADSFSLAGKSVADIANEQISDYTKTVYDPKLADLQKQIDGQMETFYFDYQPTLSNVPASSWTDEETRAKHQGDLFFWKSKGFAYRFLKDGTTWKWQLVQDTDIAKALAAAAEAQDTADGKRRVFVTTPVPPYDVGDLWAQGSAGDLMRCRTARKSGTYISSDWAKASKYTDDSAVTNLDNKMNSTEEIFKRLTQNGKIQGLYMKDGQLYINSSYIQSGTLVLGGSQNTNGVLVVNDSSKNEICRLDKDGVNLKKGQIQGPSISGSDIIGSVIRTSDDRFTIKDGKIGMYSEEYEFSDLTDTYKMMDYLLIDRCEFIFKNKMYKSNWSNFNNGAFISVRTDENRKAHLSIGTNGRIYIGQYEAEGMVSGGIGYDANSNKTTISGMFVCNATKSRCVATDDYGKRLLYCYETASPMFGDIGSGIIGEDGKCLIYIDDILSETIANGMEYYVFLQKECDCDIWIDKKEQDYFVVKGTIGAKFAWELKAKQRDYEYERLNDDDMFIDSSKNYVDYEAQGQNLYKEYIRQTMEVQ